VEGCSPKGIQRHKSGIHIRRKARIAEPQHRGRLRAS
jgi:hypothetical protein